MYISCGKTILFEAQSQKKKKKKKKKKKHVPFFYPRALFVPLFLDFFQFTSTCRQTLVFSFVSVSGLTYVFMMFYKDDLREEPLGLSFWSFLTFLHHGIEEVERHLL